MKWLNRDRMRLIVVGVVGAFLLGGGIVRADFTFGEPTNLGTTVCSTTGYDSDPSISADGLELYFIRGGDLWVTTRSTTNNRWRSPVNLGAIVNSSAHERGPSISSDGLELYFITERSGDWEICVSARPTKDHDWGTPVALQGIPGRGVDSVNISGNGLELYFSTSMGSYDVYVMRRATTFNSWGQAVCLGPNVNSEIEDLDEDLDPCISYDGLALFYARSRHSVASDECELRMSTRTSPSEPWGPSVNLDSLNSKRFDASPCVSADGSVLYFESSRSGSRGGSDIWEVPIIPILDFDGDALIGMGDLMMLIEHWGEDEPICDIGPMPWGDGIVDDADLEILMSQWGQEVSYLHYQQASQPTPLNNAISDVEKAGLIRWLPGREAAQHDVYVGMYPTAVEDADLSDTTGIYRGRQEGNEYILPEAMSPNLTFHWRIDEINMDSSLTKGPVWSFFVADYLIIDDFESSQPPWTRWWGVFGDPDNGFVLGPEFNTVHSGNQAMWLTYGNVTAPISQIQCRWETPQDWTRKGVETLIVWVHGGPQNPREPLQINLGDSAGNVAKVAHPYWAVLRLDTWQQWSIPLADVTGINLTEITSMAFVIGGETTQESGTGKIYIDDIYLHPVNPPLEPAAHWTFDEVEGATAYDSAGAYDAALVGDPAWQPEGGMIDGALLFDGLDDWVDTPFVLLGKDMMSFNSFSAFAWIKGGAPNQAIIAESNSSGYTLLMADHIGGNLMTTFLWFPNNYLHSEVNITDGQWHHVGLVWDDGARSRTLYVDHMEVAKAMGNPRRFSASGGLRIGASGAPINANFWSGLIDDIRIYQVALSPEEIAELAQ